LEVVNSRLALMMVATLGLSQKRLTNITKTKIKPGKRNDLLFFTIYPLVSNKRSFFSNKMLKR